MKRTLIVMTVAAAALSGCGADNEYQARYQLERRYYEARLLERDAYATYPFDDFIAWRVAMAAYQGVLLSNPARIPESRTWTGTVVSDMERVSLAAEIGLLRLESVDYGFHDGVSHRPPPSPLPAGLGGITLTQLSVLYDSLGTDRQGDATERRLRAITANPSLWRDTALLRDSLLAVPAMLAARRPSLCDDAEAFYSRIITTWPDSAVAARAYDYRSRVHLLTGDAASALSDIESALELHPDMQRRSELALRRCDVLAFDLGRTEEAGAALREIVAADPARERAWWARVRLALVEPPPGGPADRLRQIHLDERAPPDAAASAMFARARDLESGGRHSEAETIYWRITQRHPDTTPALAAPLAVLRSAVERGDSDTARSALRRAAEFYVQVIGRDSASLSPRYVAMDCLLEAHLTLGLPQVAAEALLEASEGLSEDARGVAGYKVAAATAHIQGNIEKSVEILEKTLELMPRSRYSRCVRWKLQRTREARDE